MELGILAGGMSLLSQWQDTRRSRAAESILSAAEADATSHLKAVQSLCQLNVVGPYPEKSVPAWFVLGELRTNKLGLHQEHCVGP